eukprot:TRINITY_DN12273_c2_g3_i1.p2 TRINITY_DN12273_c2_g3~~TRINITY_DN12273_c2_g3_i1.p2  ORF type:complete len:111 (-),score=9.07 TRINITY_DN12273_c2_g3_i1:7-339(-)
MLQEAKIFHEERREILFVRASILEKKKHNKNVKINISNINVLKIFHEKRGEIIFVRALKKKTQQKCKNQYQQYLRVENFHFYDTLLFVSNFTVFTQPIIFVATKFKNNIL